MNQAPTPEMFGNYRILKKIGEGGMAAVYLADQVGAPEGTAPVVIKRLHEQLEQDRDAVDLFLTEADVTMMLDHPNIIRVYDSGEVNGRYFMSMEYVHGKDLEQIWDRYRHKGLVMDPNLAVQIFIEILRGLDFVHNAKTPSGRALGIVHRDITPSNIYVSSTGTIKIGDFGVAKLVGVEGWTMVGSLKGKLGYMSPEQIAGERPSQTIDVWASTVIFWEMLSGQRAFPGDMELEVMLKIKGAKIPKLRKVNKAAPKPLEKLLKQALHKKEKKRFPTAGALLAAVEDYQRQHGMPLTSEELVKELSKALS